jgi:hypothetical protein
VEDLFAHPAVQAGLAPFLCALAFAAFLRKSHLAGLALAVAFTVTVGLTIGYAFDALTSVRKLVIVGWCGAVLVAVLPSRLALSQLGRSALAIAAGAAGIWVVWRVLRQQPSAGDFVLYGAGVVAYLALLMESSLRTADGLNGAAAAALIQGITAGVLCILGASALLAELGLSIAAAAAALLLVRLFCWKLATHGWAVAAFSALTLGLVDLLAVFTGSLPAYDLLPTLAIPWAVKLLSETAAKRWLATRLRVFGDRL